MTSKTGVEPPTFPVLPSRLIKVHMGVDEPRGHHGIAHIKPPGGARQLGRALPKELQICGIGCVRPGLDD